MHIAVIRFSSMGDVILQTPWIAWMKYNFPSTKITFITLESFKDLVEGHPFIDDTIYLKRKLGAKEDIKQLYQMSQNLIKDRKVDIIIDLHGTLRSKVLRLFSFTLPAITIYKRTLLRWLLVKFKWDLLKKLPSHHERVIHDLSFLFNTPSNIQDVKSFLREKTGNPLIGLSSVPASFKKSMSPLAESYIVLSPVASFASKRWPMHHVLKLVQMFVAREKYANLKIVIIAGPADDYCGDDFTNSLSSEQQKRVVNMQGKTTMSETVEYIKHGKLCVTNDTGAAHIAEALGVSSISLFGATSQSFGFRMHLDHSICLSAKTSCRPCSATGKRPCSQPTHLCMESILPEQVLESINHLLLTKKDINK